MDAKTRVRQTFNLASEGYDKPSLRFFPFAGDQLADLLKLKPGEQVLDIATGTGAFATAAGQRLRPGGRVQAVDTSEGMLSKARANVARLGLDNVEFHNMDADNLDFRPNYFDAIGCSFGIFFLDDMATALSDWLQLLKPGGRLMFTSFAPTAFEPMTGMFFEDLEAVGLEIPEKGSRTAADRLPTTDFCRSLLSDAGFINADSQSKQLGFHLGKTEDWWEILWNAGFRGYLEQLDSGQLTRLREAHLERIDSLRQEEGIWMDVETWFSGGARPLQD